MKFALRLTFQALVISPSAVKAAAAPAASKISALASAKASVWFKP